MTCEWGGGLITCRPTIKRTCTTIKLTKLSWLFSPYKNDAVLFRTGGQPVQWANVLNRRTNIIIILLLFEHGEIQITPQYISQQGSQHSTSKSQTAFMRLSYVFAVLLLLFFCIFYMSAYLKQIAFVRHPK